MILKTVCAFLAFFFELFGVYGDGEFKWNYGYVSYISPTFYLLYCNILCYLLLLSCLEFANFLDVISFSR